jgi:hypothetical protein
MTWSAYTSYVSNLLENHNFPTHIDSIFNDIKSDKLICSFIDRNCDQHQNFNNDLLLDTIVGIYLSKNKFLNVKFNYKIQDSLLIENAPRLCLNLHSNFSPLTKLVLFKNQQINILSDFPDTIKQVLRYSGIKNGNVVYFRADSAALLRAKNLLNKLQCVSSTIDFKSSVPGTFNLLSDSMLRLAYQIKPETFFGVNFVSDIGEVIYETIKVDLQDGIDANKDYILSFAQSRRKKCRYTWQKFNYVNQNQMLIDAISKLEKI